MIMIVLPDIMFLGVCVAMIINRNKKKTEFLISLTMNHVFYVLSFCWIGWFSLPE